ncbi:MAG TPA: hypothetical protein IAA57_02690 [Candidatus Pullilachnospira intestinigallinarum]|nr:hypothetical protein [Candidatus Pullilachnospira intestinigallinarum]
MEEKWVRHSVVLSVAAALVLGIAAGPLWGAEEGGVEMLMTGAFLGPVFVYPLVLTAVNVIFLFCETRSPLFLKKGRTFEAVTLVLGMVYSMLALPLTNIVIADWTEQLRNRELHTPIWTQGILTVGLLAAVGIAGYLILSYGTLSKMPPLIPVCAMAGMYLGMAECIVWIVQVFRPDVVMAYLCLLPANAILIGIKVIRRKVKEWKTVQPEKMESFRTPWLEKWNRKLLDSSRWPAAAFLVMWPLLGILICILILCGQRPDSVIRAWTETSDWRLSLREAPQNIYQDEHYLCTVAAGGHPGLVRPLRRGVRHGHPVIVNRQLCIANAFEQVLEERTPRLHRRIRKFYDRYGFPIARHIHSPYAADAVYLLMKPLEWLFLAVLYLVEVKPENRIAVQYLPRPGKCDDISLHK